MTREEELLKMVDENMQPDGSIELYPIFVYIYGKKMADAVKEAIINEKLEQGESIQMCIARMFWKSIKPDVPFKNIKKELIALQDTGITLLEVEELLTKIASEQAEEKIGRMKDEH